MGPEFASYDDVVHRIYDAALRPHMWPDVVTHMATLFGASRGMLFTWAHSPAQGGFNFTHNLPAATMEYWATKSMHEDPFVKAAVTRGLMVEGTAVNSADLVPHEVLVQTPFYKELWAPVDIEHMCCGVVFDATDTHKLPTAVSLLRGSSDPPFRDEHPELLRRLLAHLARAMGVMFHLRDRELKLAASLAALDRLTSSIILLDADRTVQFTNEAAKRLLRDTDTIECSVDQHLRLHKRLARFERTFADTLDAAFRPLTHDTEQPFSEALLLPGKDGQPQCVVHVAPLGSSGAFVPMANTARAIVFIYDVRQASSVPESLLCKLFAMTPAEARAALQLTHGGSMNAMASRLGVSVNTFKTQLKAAYLKSGTHRQSDLLKLLLSLASR